MKKNKGFIDPVSLSLILTLAIGGVGIMTDKDSAGQGQLAQDSQPQTEITAPTKEKPAT